VIVNASPAETAKDRPVKTVRPPRTQVKLSAESCMSAAPAPSDVARQSRQT
jgi:hypothetical protein